MRSLRLLPVLWGAVLLWPCVSRAAAPPVIRESVAVCDPNAPTSCVVPSSGGAIVLAPFPVTPAVGTAATIVTGGTAVTLVTGPVNGCSITNPLNAAAQGIGAAENAYVDPVGVPGSADAAGNGTTGVLQPGQPWTCPPLKAGSVVKANAATSGHKLTVWVW